MSAGIIVLLFNITHGSFACVCSMDRVCTVALHWAVYANSMDILEYLLDTCVVNRNIRCYNKKKPYHLASFMNRGDCEAILMDKKIEMAIATGEEF